LPKLNENASIFSGWPVDAPFISRLPSRDTILSASVTELSYIDQGDYIKGGFSNFSNVTMKSLYEVARKFGVEEFRIPGLDDFSINLTNLEGLPPAQLVLKLASETVREILDESFSSMGSIPVAGWVIDLIWNVADVLWTFVLMVKELDDPIYAPQVALEYSKDRDEDATNRALDYTSSNDWTDVFLPLRIPEGFKRKTVKYEMSGIEAWLVYPYGGTDFSNSLAVMPGYPQVFAEFQIAKYIKKGPQLPGVARARYVGGPPAMNMGSLFPSTQQLGLSMWSMVRNNSANAFKIDANRIETAWNDWFLALIDYIDWTEKRSDPPDQKAQVSNWLSRFTSIGLYGNDRFNLWSESGLRKNDAFLEFLEARFGTPGFMFPMVDVWQTSSDKNAPMTRMPGHYFVSWLPAIKFFLRDYMTALVEQFSKTLTIAYVGPDFPALKNPKIKQTWKEFRALLLNHSARANVELELIPDQEYRSAMAQAQSKPLLDITAPPPPPGALDIVSVPYIQPQYPTPPPLPGSGEEPVSRRRFRRSQAAMLAIMVGGAAAWKGPELVQMALRAIRGRRG